MADAGKAGGNKMYKKKCVMSIIHDGYPLKEDSGKVFMPFGSDYSIRLKNKHDEACVAKILIDGVVTNKLGDFIIQPNTSIEIDRFVDKLIDKGEKFKFVELSNKKVDDPTSEKNGIVRVEFILGKKNVKNILVDPYIYYYDYQGNDYSYHGNTNGNNMQNFCASNTNNSVSKHSSVDCCMSTNSSSKRGATIRGEDSKQSFTYGFVDLSSTVVTMELKILGIQDTKTGRYCFNCGFSIKYSDRYCFNCGSRIREVKFKC